MDQPGPVPNLATPPPIPPPALPSTGLVELDRAVAALVAQFAAHLDAALDEVFAALSHAYPGMYADPDAPTSEAVEYRVTETTGFKRWLPAPAAVQAHRLGLTVERRVVRSTEWVVEPNPNRAAPRPVPAHPAVHPDARPDPRRATVEAATVSLVPVGYPAGLTPAPVRPDDDETVREESA